jgi:hypothetical protein
MSRQQGQKCGNCRFFEVRNDAEVELAKIAKDESECAPGEWVFQGQRKVGCHGGPVRGLCAKWKERGAPGPAILSTQWCNLWQEGGPSIRGAGAGSPNVAAAAPGAPSARLAASAAVDRNANFITIAIVGILAGIGAWRKRG